MIHDDVVNHHIFSDEFENTDGLYANVESHLESAGITFPSFVTFKPVPPIDEVNWDAEKGYFAEGIEGGWESLGQLADHIESIGHAVIFNDSINNSPDVEENMGGMVFLRPNAKTGHRGILLGASDSRLLAINKYFQFFKLAKAYLENPDDLMLAYSFLECHPAFWYLPKGEKHQFNWQYESGLHSLWIGLTKNKGKTVVMLEHGPSVAPAYHIHSHDHYLDVYAPSFDEAYIQLAKNVHKHYYLDGQMREDVKGVGNPDVEEAARRLDEWKKENASTENKEQENTNG